MTIAVALTGGFKVLSNHFGNTCVQRVIDRWGEWFAMKTKKTRKGLAVALMASVGFVN